MTKEKLKNICVDFLLGFLAGVSISIGGIVNIVSGSKIGGAILFCVGLFLVLTLNLNLFTGKVCYVTSNKPSYLLKLAVIWLSNLCGCVVCGYILRSTRLVSFASACENIVNTKLNDSLWSLFVLAIFCNILIFIAVDGFKNRKSSLGKYLSLFFGVSVFVVARFEHCVADMFYFSFANMWSGRAWLSIIVITLGNCVGGLFLPIITKLVLCLQKQNDTSSADTNNDEN